MSFIEYAEVVFMQGDDANEAFAVADEADDFRGALLAHLSGWDYGEYGDTSSEPSHGNYDDTYETPEYVLSWNRALGYCGLTAKIASS